jgi:hypothetical protein
LILLATNSTSFAVSAANLRISSVVTAGFSVSQLLRPPAGIREIHKRLVLQYFVASPEPFQSSVSKPGNTKPGLGALVSAEELEPVCVAWRKERRFE